MQTHPTLRTQMHKCKHLNHREVLGPSLLGRGRAAASSVSALEELGGEGLTRKIRFLYLNKCVHTITFNNRNVLNLSKYNVKLGKEGKVHIICRQECIQINRMN